MKALKLFSTLSVIFVVCLLTPSHVRAGETAGSENIATLRRFLNQQDWTWYAAGLMAAFNAMDGVCVHPGTVGEMAAYLQYTASDSKTAVQAVKDDWDRRSCRIPEERAKAAWFNPLVHARTTVDDVVYLRTLVQFSGQDEVGMFMRMLATDGLRELGEFVPPLKPVRPTQ